MVPGVLKAPAPRPPPRGAGVRGRVQRDSVQGECPEGQCPGGQCPGSVFRGHGAGHSPAGKASPPARIKPVQSPRWLAVDRTCPQSPQVRPTPSVATCVTCLWRLIKVTGGDEGGTVSQQPCFYKKRPRALPSPYQLHFGQKTRRGHGDTARPQTRNRTGRKNSLSLRRLGAGLWCPGSAV